MCYELKENRRNIIILICLSMESKFVICQSIHITGSHHIIESASPEKITPKYQLSIHDMIFHIETTEIKNQHHRQEWTTNHASNLHNKTPYTTGEKFKILTLEKSTVPELFLLDAKVVLKNEQQIQCQIC